MSRSTVVAWLFASALAGCGALSSDKGAQHQQDDVSQSATSYVQPTLHAGEPRQDWLRDGARRQLFPIYVAATASAPVELAFTIASNGQPMKLAVMSPPGANGDRTTLGEAGYDAPTEDPSVTIPLTETGTYAVVIEHYDAHRAFAAPGDPFTVRAACTDTGSACAATDAIENYKVGALAGATAIDVMLNPSLADQSVAVTAAFAPPFGAEATPVATATAIGGVAHLELPQPLSPTSAGSSQLADGDDVFISVDGFDDGTRLRLWLSGVPGVSSVGVSDFHNVFYVSGVAAPFEGQTNVSLYSETKEKFLATSHLQAYLPGHDDSGLLEYSTSLVIGDADAADTPSNGDILTITENNGAKGSDVRRYCFRFCDDLSGNDPDCAITPVTCPAGDIGG